MSTTTPYRDDLRDWIEDSVTHVPFEVDRISEEQAAAIWHECRAASDGENTDEGIGYLLDMINRHHAELMVMVLSQIPDGVRRAQIMKHLSLSLSLCNSEITDRQLVAQA